MRFQEIDLILLITLLLLIVAIVIITVIIFAFINLKKQRKNHAVEIDKFNDYKIKEQNYIEKNKQQLNEKEDRLEEKQSVFSDKVAKFEHDSHIENQRINEEYVNIAANKADLKEEKALIDKKLADKLLEVSELTQIEARNIVLKNAEELNAKDIAKTIEETKIKIDLEKKNIAKDILLEAIENNCVETVNEVVLKQIKIPNNEVKGKLIGRAGRNIRTMENLLGVNIIIDDSPDNISISSFNPIRRAIATQVLENLIETGRINQVAIEEEVIKCSAQIEDYILEKGKEAIYKFNITDMNVALVNLIGKLAFRSSYGQNMLEHSIECAYIASKIANDLSLNPTLAARCCLLHDIGKVDSVETGKSHVELGVLYAKENKEDEIVINAIEAHHGDVEPTSEYAVLTIIADSVSAGRAGSRKNAYENYVERVSSLENIATKYDGVQSAFALQGGREVRVIVHNDQISDELMPKLASDIKREIESTITFPGTINVNIIRESRFNVEASKENVMEYND